MCALLITCNVENITLYKNKLLYTWKFLEGYLKLLKVVHSREWREGGRDCWKEERIGDFTFSFYITHNNKTKLKSLLWQKLCLVFFTRDVIILWKYRWYNIKAWWNFIHNMIIKIFFKKYTGEKTSLKRKHQTSPVVVCRWDYWHVLTLCIS